MGLSFVFTGELSSFSREEAVDLGKRFGGWVICYLYLISLFNIDPAVLWANHQVEQIL